LEERITITMDSGFDVPEEMIKQYHIKVIPVSVHMGNRELQDGEITPEEMVDYFYNHMKQIITTSPPSIEDYYGFFTRQMHMGYTVIHLSMSSIMSYAYENAILGAETFRKVHVIDTRSVAVGAVPFIRKIAELQEQGMKAEQIAESLKEFYKKVHLSCLLNTIDFLHAGGKVRPVGKFLVLFFGMKPSAVLDPDDYFVPDKKFKGEYETAAMKYIQHTLGRLSNVRRDCVYFSYTSGCDDRFLEKCENGIRETGADFEHIEKVKAGCAITSHFGNNCILLCWVNK